MTFITERAQPKTMSIVSALALLVFLPLMLLAVQNIVVLVSRASGSKANIMVDTKAILEPVETSFYHAYAQGGEEAGDMLAPVIADIKAIKPRVIRLDHLYGHYNVDIQSDGTITGWGSLDGAINSILATGAKPILALSYMPAAIAKDGKIINPPNDWNAWARVVQQTIEHFSGKGNKNISGIYYEVWNEPDLAQFGSWKPASYVTLYKYASTGAKNAQNVNTFYLGGPSTTGLYKTWILALINSGARVDFLSWHTYQTDPNYYDKDQRNIIDWLAPYPSYVLIPKLITEFGFTGDKSNLYGTTYASAHAAAVITKLISGGPTYLMSFQPKDGPGQESGNGWGFITHESNGLKKKPRYYLFNFIDNMAGNKLALSGEGTWVTGFASTKDTAIRVLLTNFRGAAEQVPVTFTNLDLGTYSLRTKYLYGTDTKTTITVTAPTYQTKIPLTGNSIVMLELTKN